jgi:hypothetical protein
MDLPKLFQLQDVLLDPLSLGPCSLQRHMCGPREKLLHLAFSVASVF